MSLCSNSSRGRPSPPNHKSYMAGVRHLHISEGYGDPFTHDLHRLHYVLCGIKCAGGIAGVAKRERQPITPDKLRNIKCLGP